jgi:hypothetical protein
MRQERSDLAQLRYPSHDILLSAVTASEQAESAIRSHRRQCCQLNCHTETSIWVVDAARKLPMEVNIGFQSCGGRPGNQSTKQTEVSSNSYLTCAIQNLLIAGLLCDRSQITRSNLLTQQVSHQLPIYPTIIHTQITTNQPTNKGVVSFQLHFSEQLHNLKSAQ